MGKKQKEMQEVMAIKAKIEAPGKYTFEKKTRPGSGKIYGSLTQTNVAEAIAKETGIPVRLTAIQLPKISELGEFSATVELSLDVTAFIKLDVVQEGSQAGGEEEEEED